MIFKEKRDDETFVYMNGSLLYKIWHGITSRSSILFEKYGPPTRNTDRDKNDNQDN